MQRSPVAANLRKLSESDASSATKTYFEMEMSERSQPVSTTVPEQPADVIIPIAEPIANNAPAQPDNDNLANLIRDIQDLIQRLENRPTEHRKLAILLPLLFWSAWAITMLVVGLQVPNQNDPYNDAKWRNITFRVGYIGGMILFVSTILYASLFGRKLWNGAPISRDEWNGILNNLRDHVTTNLQQLEVEEFRRGAVDTLLPVDRSVIRQLELAPVNLGSDLPRRRLIALLTPLENTLLNLQREINNKGRPLTLFAPAQEVVPEQEDMGLRTLFAQP